MLRYVLAFILLVLAGNRYVQAQRPLPDVPDLSDTTKVKALTDSSFEYSYSAPDKAIRFARKALNLATEIGYRKGVAGAHRELGYSWSVKGAFAKSMEHFEKGIAISRQIGDTLALIKQLSDLGSAYTKQSRYEKALEYHFESLHLCEHIGLERGISVNLSNIGLAYFELDEDEKALEFYTRALELNRQRSDSASLSDNYNNIGLLHGDQGRDELAVEYLEKALDIRRTLGYRLRIANSLNNLGRVYMRRDQHEKALDYLYRALEVNDNRDQNLSSIIRENLARTYLSAGRYDSALVNARKTRVLSQKYGTDLGVKVASELLTSIYRELGQFERAFETQQHVMALKDSILNAEKMRQINELQTKYETTQKEKEIELLEKEKEQETLLRNAFLAGLILIGIIGFLIYNRQRLKIRKKRMELENKQLIERQMERDIAYKNKQLTTHTLHIVQKNETMKNLKKKIQEIRAQENGDVNRSLQKLKNMVDYSFCLDEDWEQFRFYFENVHTGFFEALKQEYPDLTPNELRLAALARLNLSIKKTATVLGIAPNSVKTERYRLRKKLGLQTGENLTDFLMKLENEYSAHHSHPA